MSVAIEDFEGYADNPALAAEWSGAIQLAVGDPVTPYGVQCVAIGLDNGSGPAWGDDSALASHTFTGLTPDTPYHVRFKMAIGTSRSSVIGGFPTPHTFTAGLQANADRYLVAVIDMFAPEGLRMDAGLNAVGVDELYAYPRMNITGDTICSILSLCGWQTYELATTSDSSGEIEVTIGVFDARFFQVFTFFDDIEIVGESIAGPVTETYAGGIGGTTSPVDPEIFPPPMTSRGGRVFLDSFLEYDGRDAAAIDGFYPLSAMTLSGGTLWIPGETLTLTAGSVMFSAANIGHQFFLHAPDDSVTVKFTITAIVSATVAQGVSDIDIPVSMQGVSLTLWDIAVSTVGNLEHLEGKDVGIVGDGLVVASPYHPGVPIRTVTDGVVDLGGWYAHVYVGLPYVADIETLDIDTASGPSLKPQAINVTKAGVILDESPARGLYAASSPPPTDVFSVAGMQELRQPSDADYADPVTEYIDVNTMAHWNRHGRVFLRDVDPLLLTVLGIIPNGFIPPSGS